MTSSKRPAAPPVQFLAMGCVGMISSAWPAQAQAPAAPPATDLGGVTVTDTAVDEGSYRAERSANPKLTAPLVDTPRTIAVVGEQLLKDTASTTLTEALRTVPGITFGAGEGGNPLGDRPFIRGFDSQNSLYLDGVRDLGASTRETFDVAAIEVTKGSDGVVNGSGNAGGSINIVSKQPTAERSARVEGSYGNADYKRVTVDIDQPVNDFVGVRLNAMYHDQGFAGRDEVYQKRWGVAPSVTFGLAGPTSLTFDYYHLHTDELPDGGIPYTYTLANQPTAASKTRPAEHFTAANGQTYDVPRGTFYGLDDRDFRHTRVDEATMRFRHEFANGFVLRDTSRYARSYQDYIWTMPDDSQGNVGSTGQVWRRINNRYGTYTNLTNQADLTGKFATGGLRHSIAASAEYQWQQSSYGSFVSNPATGAAIATGSTVNPRCNPATIARYYCTSVDHPNPHDPWASYASDTSTTPAAIGKSLPIARTLSRATDVTTSLFDTVTVTDWLLVNLGGRYDHYALDVSPGVAAPYTARRVWTHRDYDLWTYQAGAVVKPAANGSIYVSTSKSAIPPGSFLSQGSEDNAATTSGTITADDLKVQKTTSYEVGTKWDLFDQDLSLTLALFQTRTTNARTTNPDGTLSYVGTRRIRGVELGFAGNVTPAWSVFGGFVYMPSKVLDAGVTRTTVGTVSIVAPAAATGHPFPNTAKTSLTAFTTYKVTRRLSVGGGAIHMGEVYGGFSDSRTIQNGALVISKTRATYVPAYWRFDANAAFQLTDRIGVRVNALNLTNKRYYDQAYATHYAHQAAGRTVLGTLSLSY